MKNITSDFIYDVGIQDYIWKGKLITLAAPPPPPLILSSPHVYTLWTAIMARIGLMLLQSASPTSSLAISHIQGICDLGVSTVIFALAGRHFAFSESKNGLVELRMTPWSHFIEGWPLLLITSGLVTTAMSGRISLIATIIMSTIFSGFIYPFLYNWSFNDQSWMRNMTIIGANVAYTDYGGNNMIHVYGGFCAILIIVLLGRRLFKLIDIDVAYIYSPFSLVLGYIMLITGLTGFFLATTAMNADTVCENVLLAIAFAFFGNFILITFLWAKEIDMWIIQKCFQAATAAAIAVMPVSGHSSPIIAAGVGVIASIIAFAFGQLVELTPVDDVHNILGVHWIPATLQCLIGPFIISTENKVENIRAGCLWMIVCLLAGWVLIGIIYLPFFFLMDACRILRNPQDLSAYQRAKSIAKRQSRSFRRLFDKKTAALEPSYYLSPELIIKSIAETRQ